MSYRDERILITGCGGMLGQAVHAVFAPLCPNLVATDIDLNEEWLKELDVRDIRACEKFFDEFKPTIVMHLAALTDLEYCERNPREAWRTNALGTENVAMLAERHGATLVYIGTAGVFDGLQDSYTDFDRPNPINHYGASKYHGERFVQEHVSKFFVFRAGWMMGSGPRKDKKFINKIFKQIQAGKKELFVVNDKSGAPTYTHDFANGIAQVVPTGYYGLYNQVCHGSGTRYDIAKEFVRLLGLEKEVAVTEVTSDHFKQDYFAPRPACETLINMKLEERGLNFMRPWQECLAEYARVYSEELVKQPEPERAAA
jgi:dTDP-4-dehydrorhamnose reductase